MRLSVMTFFLAGLMARAAVPAATPLPDDPACTSQDRVFMARAYELARIGSTEGNSPIGAVLVKDGKIIAEGWNTVTTDGDVTHHAETGLISLLSPHLDKATLATTTLYTSTEPCIMCCGSITFAGIRECVYGTTALQVTRIAGRTIPLHPIECREVFQRINSKVVIRGPLMEEEGFAVRREYLARHAPR